MKNLIVLVSLWSLTLAIDPLVNSTFGQIRGLKDDRGFTKFLGVPYGKLDENNIFGAAFPHPGFESTFEAYDDTNYCAQFHNDVKSGTIDCLNLNIYVPDTANSDNRLPVMVWIHGGAWIYESAIAYGRDPYSLLRHDVIVIGINYRLGIYGFMCLDIPEVPGNSGLKDQVLALRWIKQNIEAFSGDSNQITVFGESAGGMSINLHLYSTSEKLFEGAIIQSGPANSYWMMVKSNATIPFRLAEEFGFHTTDIREALSFISTIDPQTLVKVAFDLKISNAVNRNQALTKPCVEQKFDGVENFIADHPMNIKATKASETPILIGYNNNEMGTFATADAEFYESYDFSQHFRLGFDMDNDLDEAIEMVNQFYLGDAIISEDHEEVKFDIANFVSDIIFNHPTKRMVEIFQDSGAKTIYSYIFSYEGSSNKSWTGAIHAEELQYLFDLNKEKTEEDQILINQFTELWTNFVKYGNPTPASSRHLPTWTPISEANYPYLDIDLELTMNSRPFHKRMAFWDLFYLDYGKYQMWYKDSTSP